MSNPAKVLYTSTVTPISHQCIESAVTEAFDKARITPGYDMENYAGVAVVLDPSNVPRTDKEFILAIGAIGDLNPIEEQDFTLHAMIRAFDQSVGNRMQDSQPMERHNWVSKRSPNMPLDRSCAVSVDGLHVAAAGGLAHHNRLFAIGIAKSLAQSGYRYKAPAVHRTNRPLRNIPAVVNEQEAALNLAWLNTLIRKDGENPKEIQRRGYFKSLLDQLVTSPDIPRSA